MELWGIDFSCLGLVNDLPGFVESLQGIAYFLRFS